MKGNFIFSKNIRVLEPDRIKDILKCLKELPLEADIKGSREEEVRKDLVFLVDEGDFKTDFGPAYEIRPSQPVFYLSKKEEGFGIRLITCGNDGLAFM